MGFDDEKWEASKRREMGDIFAAVALTGLLASGDSHIDGQGDPERYARLAYDYADALLIERDKRAPKPPNDDTQL